MVNIEEDWSGLQMTTKYEFYRQKYIEVAILNKAGTRTANDGED